MQIRLDGKLQKELEVLSKKDLKLFKKVQKQLNLFADNPKHKSLRVHKLSGELENMRSISITKSIRMSYLQNGNEAYFFDIGTHDEVYRKK
ncbi:plasmid stabilization protein [Candidatus Daviesbacteria bacterium]|nr:plasmid stabilization protein [Candidatus Daviesbacteria bacterium]